MAQPTYDQITRNTVPEPDSSFRPSQDQERAAFEGARILSAEETALSAKVADALRASGLDVSALVVEIDDTRVTLRGHVSEIHLLPRLEAAVRSVAGVGDIVDLAVVAPR